jgi:hypothetical protein
MWDLPLPTGWRDFRSKSGVWLLANWGLTHYRKDKNKLVG